MLRSVRTTTEPHIDAEVIGLYEGEEPSHAADGAVQSATKRKGYSAEQGQIVEAFPDRGPRVILLGLGPREGFGLAQFRKGAAELAKHIERQMLGSVHFRIEFGREYGRAMGEALGLRAWNRNAFRGSRKEAEAEFDLAVSASTSEFDEGLGEGLALAESANVARTLAFTPPAIATPDYVADECERIAKELALEFRVLRGGELEKERLAGLINVGKGSVNPPCMIRMAYVPEGAASDPPIVLLGKTITFDTGGYCIKTRQGMGGMKYDKSGGCAVLGAMHAIAKHVKPNRKVVGLLVAAENRVSDDAYVPDDVITYRNGVTVEVTNTDAEGRLVLADGLCWACDVEQPDCIVDIATLTGGVVTALGIEYAGLFANDDALCDAVLESGKRTGERCWRLPLDEEYEQLMDSPAADMVNSNKNGQATPVQGATFLSNFVGDSVPWAHLDIAGVADHEYERGVLSPGPSGFGVRLMADFVAGYGGGRSGDVES